MEIKQEGTRNAGWKSTTLQKYSTNRTNWHAQKNSTLKCNEKFNNTTIDAFLILKIRKKAQKIRTEDCNT